MIINENRCCPQRSIMKFFDSRGSQVDIFTSLIFGFEMDNWIYNQSFSSFMNTPTTSFSEMFRNDNDLRGFMGGLVENEKQTRKNESVNLLLTYKF